MKRSLYHIQHFQKGNRNGISDIYQLRFHRMNHINDLSLLVLYQPPAHDMYLGMRLIPRVVS